MRFGEHEKVLVGSHPATTNNVMEMVAVWHGLMAVTRPSPVVVYSDSSYVLDGLRKGWVERWQRNGWRTRDGRDVANGGLWRVLEIAARKHRVRWEQVAGHSGVTLNERCDLLAMMQVPEAEAPGMSELDEAFDAVLADPLT